MLVDHTKSFDNINHNKLWKILKGMRIPDHLSPEKHICRSRGNS